MKSYFLATSMVIVLTLFAAQLWASNPVASISYDKSIMVADDDTDTVTPLPVGDFVIPVIVKKVPSDDNQRSIVPISAVYNNGTMELDFYGNMGTLYVTVVNNTTGECRSEYIDTVQGYAYMNVASYHPTGFYTIMFYSDNHGNYGGDFYVE